MLWWLIQNALGAALLAAGAALLSRSTRLSPSARHALWLVVILKLLAPPLLLWPCPWDAPAAASVQTIVTPTGTPVLSPVTLVAGLWLIGAAAMALFQTARLLDLRLRLRGATKPPRWLCEEASRLADDLEVKLPRIVVTPSLGSPLLIGGFRPRLVVPESLLERLDLPAWRSVLTHELAHLKRRDHWVGWLELLGACVWWWNPVFWYARRRLRENAEFACDAWVVRLLPQNRRGYAESLITVIDTLAWKPATVAAIGMAAGGQRIFERRLEMILREAVPHRMSTTTTAAALLIALMALPGWALPTASAVEVAPAAIVVAQPQTVAAPLTVEARPQVRVAPTETVEAVIEKPVKPKPQRAKRRTTPIAARKTEVAVASPAPANPREQANLALVDTIKPLESAPKASETPLAALKTPSRIDLTADKSDESPSLLQNVKVGGEIRIRYQHYSK